MGHPNMRCISFTYVPMVSMWVFALHSLFLYSDPPLPCHPPSDWLRLFSSQTFSHINTPTFSTLIILHTYLPMKMEQTECSKTLAYKIQTPGNYPEESTQHSEHDESLKSRICMLLAKVSTIKHRLQSSHNNEVHTTEQCDFKKLWTLSLCTLFIWAIKCNFTSICIILPKEATHS